MGILLRSTRYEFHNIFYLMARIACVPLEFFLFMSCEAQRRLVHFLFYFCSNRRCNTIWFVMFLLCGEQRICLKLARVFHVTKHVSSILKHRAQWDWFQEHHKMSQKSISKVSFTARTRFWEPAPPSLASVSVATSFFPTCHFHYPTTREGR